MGGKGSGQYPRTEEQRKRLKEQQPAATAKSALTRKDRVLLSKALKVQLAKLDPEDEQGRCYAETIAEKIAALARGPKGGAPSVKAAEFIADRTEGGVPRSVDVKVETRSPAEIAQSILSTVMELDDGSSDTPVN